MRERVSLSQIAKLLSMFSRAHSADLPQLETLERACFPAETWSRATLSQVLVEPRFRVWMNERAFLVASKVGDEAEIERVGVLPQFRGRGVGESLLRWAIEELKREGVRHVFLEVSARNETAQRLYVRCGFEEIGARVGYYDDGSDAILMRFGG